MTLRKPIEFATTTSATTTSRWYVLDYAYDENPERAYGGSNSTNGQVVIQVAVSVNAVGDDGLSNPTRIITANTITSASFNGTIHGNWPLVRFINSGGNTGSWITAII